MSTFAQSQRKKEIKQCALELNKLSKIGSNRNCADCGHKPAKWVSITFGCWLCSKCAGIHRGLGVHITFIKSTTLDDWNYELLNKFKSLGGNEAVNKVYEGKLKKRDKINHETNEYKSIEFITKKYVEKKWMIKEQHNHKKKKKKKFDKRRSESKIKRYQQRHNSKPQKKKMVDYNEEGKVESAVPDLLNFNEEHKNYEDDDKPSNWVKFTENEGEIEIAHIEDGDHMMPSLLDLNEMNNFAFSDLAQGNVENVNHSINVDQDIMSNNNLDNKDVDSNRIDKAAILSMYKADNNGNFDAKRNYNNYSHINPMIRINPPSPFPKRHIHGYIYNNYYGYNHSSNIMQPPLNQNIAIINMNNNNNNIALKSEEKQENEVVIDGNPFRNDDNMNINMNMNINKSSIEVNAAVKFNPFDYINDLVGNTGSYVYSANVSC